MTYGNQPQRPAINFRVIIAILIVIGNMITPGRGFREGPFAYIIRLLRRERRAPHLRRRRHRRPGSPPVGTARHRLRPRSPPSDSLWPACSRRHHLLRKR